MFQVRHRAFTLVELLVVVIIVVVLIALLLPAVQAASVSRFDIWMLLLTVGTFAGAYPLMYFAQEYIPLRKAIVDSAAIAIAIIGVRACTLMGFWSPFKADTSYFAPSESSFMVNYRVEDLHALLAKLREEGCNVDEKVEESEFGKFGWVMDPEGNKLELWQPPEGQ